MKYANQIPVAVAGFCLAGCAGAIPQFSDYIYSATLVSGDENSAEVTVAHGLNEDDVAQVVWIARAAYPVAQAHCGSMGKTASTRYETERAGSGPMVFRFSCVAVEDPDTGG